jgi:hypothetical protein
MFTKSYYCKKAAGKLVGSRGEGGAGEVESNDISVAGGQIKILVLFRTGIATSARALAFLA